MRDYPHERLNEMVAVVVVVVVAVVISGSGLVSGSGSGSGNNAPNDHKGNHCCVSQDIDHVQILLQSCWDIAAVVSRTFRRCRDKHVFTGIRL